MKAFRLSFRAERSLDEIAQYSRRTFGASRGKTYVQTLLDRCRDVAEGRVPHQSCRNHFAADLDQDLRFIRAGQHYVIFVEGLAEIAIIDFIHQSADIGGRLGGPQT